MIALRISLPGLLLVLLGGCSFLQSFHSQSPEYIDTLIREQQYGKAQRLLEHISPSRPEQAALLARKKRLVSLIAQFESRTLAEVAELRRQNHWQKAEEKLAQARARLPDSPVLQKAGQEFIAARQRRIEQLNMQIDIHKGIWLRDVEPLLDAIVRTQPDDYERQQQLRQFRRDKARILKSLVRCAREAMAAELYETGRRCLNLADQIDSQNRYGKELQSARLKLQRHDHAWHRKQIETSDALLKELKQGYSHDNLLRTSRHLQKLNSHNQTADEKQYSALLQQELDKGIAQSMDAGRQLYSEGRIKEALNIWTRLREIAPDNEVLEAHIARAQRVLEKLQRLKQQPSPVD